MKRATLEIGGPANLTFDQLAHAVQNAAGRAAPPKHVPSPVLRLMANTVGRLKPQLGRQTRAALVMDSVDLTFDTVGIHTLYPPSFAALRPLRCSLVGAKRSSRSRESSNYRPRDTRLVGRPIVRVARLGSGLRSAG
jgi:hypothetical protein